MSDFQIIIVKKISNDTRIKKQEFLLKLIKSAYEKHLKKWELITTRLIFWTPLCHRFFTPWIFWPSMFGIPTFKLFFNFMIGIIPKTSEV